MGRSYIYIPNEAQVKLRVLRAIDRPIEQITVGEICSNSNISRQTFYRYFDSKFGISYWFFDFLDELFLDKVGRELSWDEAYTNAFEMLFEESKFLKNAFAENPRVNEVEPRLERKYENTLKTLELFKHIKLDEELLFYAHFYIYFGHEIIVDWCMNGAPIAPDKFQSYFTQCMPHKLYELLKTPSIVDKDM